MISIVSDVEQYIRILVSSFSSPPNTRSNFILKYKEITDVVMQPATDKLGQNICIDFRIDD